MDDTILKETALGDAAGHATPASAPRTHARRGGSRKTVGIVGWRGMVGSVLMERMTAEGDFDEIEPVFFSTSSAGREGPTVAGRASGKLHDANSIDALSKLDVVLTCQGGDWTKAIYPQLRASGWNGYWIDAASTLRMEDDAVIVLDPINLDAIKRGLSSGIRNYIGGNCTVSLMLMGMHGLFKEDLVEWTTAMTYQAASGAGAANMRELVRQMGAISDAARPFLADDASPILDLDRSVSATLASPAFPRAEFGHKILGRTGADIVPIDGLCVRVGVMRCHSQALTIKLRREVPLADVEAILREANPWVSVVPNDKETTLSDLTPEKVTGTLSVPIGRLRRLYMGPEYLSAFTVGDQLLWGAAEPLRRMLRILLS